MPAIKSTALEDVNAESNRPGVSDSGQMARIEDRRFGWKMRAIVSKKAGYRGHMIEGNVMYS